MICSCGNMMSETKYFRTEEGHQRESIKVARCSIFGRIEFKDSWAEEPKEKSQP